jgi:hypothetical protein
MIKIKLECWWTDTLSLNTRMIRQFVPSADLIDYSLVTENPDYTIVFGRTDWDKIETSKEKTFYVSQEPLWSPNQPRDGIHDYCSKILISDKLEYPDREEYIETLLPMFYAGRGENDHRKEWDWSSKLKDKGYSKNKSVSIIVRKDTYSHYNHLQNPNTNKINYEERTNLGIELSKDNRIDVYGTYWVSNGENIKGEVWNKHVGLDDYKFSVACENTIQKNYISEKFWDAVLTNTIPIYLGCSNISELITDGCYISLNNMSMEEMVDKVKYIVDNESDLYEQYSDNIKKLKKDFFINPKYNIWERIKMLINE